DPLKRTAPTLNVYNETPTAQLDAASTTMEDATLKLGKGMMPDDATQMLPKSSSAQAAHGGLQRWQKLSIAAAALLILAVVYLVVNRDEAEAPEASSPDNLVLEVAAHEEGALTLMYSADGTRLITGGAD